MRHSFTVRSPLPFTIASRFWGPAHGKTKPLRGEIWEFIFGRLPGSGFRVYWFYGAKNSEIICSQAFLKKTGQPEPTDVMDSADEHWKQYFTDLARGRIRRRILEVSELWPK